MGPITVDQDRCNRDGLCAQECSPAIIRMSETTGFPEMIPGGEEICIRCGHCVTVCPRGALSHEDVPLALASPLEEALAVSEAQAVQFLRSRRSVRLFQSRPVEREKVIRLIETARYAPTAGNSQTVEWLVHTDRTRLREMAAHTVEWVRGVVKSDPTVALTRPYLPRIVTRWEAGRDSVLRDAPVLIIASAPKEAVFGLVDLTLALSYLDLLAPTLGLGTCWAGLLEGALLALPSLREMAAIPGDHAFHYPMMLGYPVMKHHRLPVRKPPTITFP